MSVEDGIPETGQATQPHDWERDYKALQAEYTRSQQALKDADVWEDESAALARLAEKHPHLFEEESDDTEETLEDDEDDPVAPLRSDIEQFKKWQATVENERGEARFKNDLATELGETKVPEKVTAWIKARTLQLGNNPKALKDAVAEYREIETDIRGPQRKPAPTPPQPGKAAEEDYNASKDPEMRRRARRARIAAQVEAGTQQ